MHLKLLGKCPACGGKLHVNLMSCPTCHTKIEGQFDTCKFCQLDDDQLNFVEAFIKCRGNIKEVEKELQISYPTVKSRLDDAIKALGYAGEKVVQKERRAKRIEVLRALEADEITPEEAVEMLK